MKKVNPDQQIVQKYLDRAAEKFDREDYEGAISDCQEVLRMDPSNPEIYFIGARIKICLGDYTMAKILLNTAICLNPNRIDYLLYRSFAKDKMGDCCGAIEDYLKARELTHGTELDYFYRGTEPGRKRTF